MQKVKDKRQSCKPGNLSIVDNTYHDELFDITNKVKKNDLQTASIILDLNSKKIIKNRLNQEATFDDLFKYFLISYDRAVSVVMGEIDPEYLKNAHEKILAEVEDLEAKNDQPVETVQG